LICLENEILECPPDIFTSPRRPKNTRLMVTTPERETKDDSVDEKCDNVKINFIIEKQAETNPRKVVRPESTLDE
jgi:hypothetical protein